MRTIATLMGGVAVLLLATASQAAEVTGTVISNDPTGGTVLVRTTDGQTLTVRTDETTRVQKGDAVVESTTLMRGQPVQIVTVDVPTGQATTTVAPVATRILLVPAAPSVVEDKKTDVDIDTDSGDDAKVKIHTRGGGDDDDEHEDDD